MPTIDQFVARGHRPFIAEVLVGSGEQLADRQSVRRKVVMAEDAAAVGIDEDAQPPGAGCRCLNLRHEGQLGVDAPGGGEITRKDLRGNKRIGLAARTQETNRDFC